MAHDIPPVTSPEPAGPDPAPEAAPRGLGRRWLLSSALAGRVRVNWLSNVRADVLAGLVVALALIPEAISFSVIAGVDPRVGLYASFTIAIIIAFAGGRPGMISAATAAMALVIVPLVRDHGVEYLFAATILTGLIQVLLGWLGVAQLMRFVPRTVLVGFVNALAILIFLAQVPHVLGESWHVYAMVAAGLGIIYLLPRLTKVVPSALVAIVALAVGGKLLGVDVPTVGDMGELPSALPWVALPAVPLSYETLKIIAPYAMTLAFVGLLESFLTAQIIDDMTDTRSDAPREARGQGIANVATGFLGGMAGCAMIGQSIINIRSGGTSRLSTLAAGVFLLVLIMALGDLVGAIPMAALVAIMVVVALSTFDWSSIRRQTLRRTPVTETAVVAVTVATVVITHNLAIGVTAGVLLSIIFFARHVAHLVEVTRLPDLDEGVHYYVVTGELFFASTNELVHAFDYTDPGPKVMIDLSASHIWDSSAVVALDAVVERFEAHGVTAELVGLNDPSDRLHKRLTGQLASSH